MVYPIFAYMHCNIHTSCLCNVHLVHCNVQFNDAPKGPYIVSNSHCAVLEKHTIRSNWEQHNSGEQRQESSSSYLSMGCCGRYVVLDGSAVGLYSM